MRAIARVTGGRGHGVSGTAGGRGGRGPRRERDGSGYERSGPRRERDGEGYTRRAPRRERDGSGYERSGPRRERGGEGYSRPGPRDSGTRGEPGRYARDDGPGGETRRAAGRELRGARLELPEEITADQLDPEARAELRTLPGH